MAELALVEERLVELDTVLKPRCRPRHLGRFQPPNEFELMRLVVGIETAFDFTENFQSNIPELSVGD